MSVREPVSSSAILAGPTASYGRWMRRRAALLGAGLILGAVAGGALALLAPSTYQADTVVVARTTALSADSFGSVAKTVFGTQPVLQPVIQQFHLTSSPKRLLSTGTLSISPVSGAAAVRIGASTGNPTEAAGLSLAAARSFVSVATASGVGTFAVLPTGSVSSHRSSPVSSTVAGAIAGLLVALGAATAWFALRRPVVTEGDVRRIIPADHVFTAQVRPPGHRRGADERLSVRPRGLVGAIWRLIQERAPDGPTCIVVAPASRTRDRRPAETLTTQLADGHVPHGEAKERPESRVVVFGDDGLSDSIARARAAVIVLPRGTRERDLRRIGQELTLASGLATRIAVLLD